MFSCAEQLQKFRCVLVGQSVGRSKSFVKMWPSEYHMVTKTYLTSNLCFSSDSSESSDSCDSCDSSDSSDISDSSDSRDFFFLHI